MEGEGHKCSHLRMGQKTLVGGGGFLIFTGEIWMSPLRIDRIWAYMDIIFEFSDVSQSIHKDGFLQSLM